MYLSHFGLQDPPFTLTPDTSYFFGYSAHSEALDVLMVALDSGEGFVKVTGEVGTGKTLLCRMLLRNLSDNYVTAYVPNPFLTPSALRMALADELGIEVSRNIGGHRVVKAINDRLLELAARGKRVVLLLDEAQALPHESLEALRLLTNLETEKEKLLQVVLFGQPELDRRLRDPGERQVRQRISFSCRLSPLDVAGVEGYVRHRLEVAGYSGQPLFTRRAIRRIARDSRGIPRLVNVLCHKSMMAAYGEGCGSVSLMHVRSAADDSEDVMDGRQGIGALLRRSRMRWASLATAFGAGLGVYFWSSAH